MMLVEMGESMTNKKYGVFMSILLLIGGYLFSSFMAVGFALLGTFMGNILYADVAITCAYFVIVSIVFLSIYFENLRKRPKFNDKILFFNIGYILLTTLLFSLLFIGSKASLLDPGLPLIYVLVFPFFPFMIILSLFANTYVSIISIGIIFLFSLLYSLIILRNKKWYFSLIIYGLCTVLCLFTYVNSPNHKYAKQGHNFSYMSGFSSVDLYDYALYNEKNKLVTIDSSVEKIEGYKNMPIMDGAEACYPVYGAIAKAIYEDVEKIERDYYYRTKQENGLVVTFHNTAVGFEGLVNGAVDMFFGAKPSVSQLEFASSKGVELEYTPIGKEGFVFFVNEENPIDNLTTQQIKDIYSGRITNWKEVGGKNEKIIAFQRPERSGSQSMMVYFMGDIPLKEPLTYEMEYAMLGIIEEVAQYHNEDGAIGYSFRYYFDGMTQVEGAKMIAVDGVYPSTESITSGEYPIVTPLYCITVKDNQNENVQKVIDFMLSEDGQYIIEKTGYSPVE